MSDREGPTHAQNSPPGAGSAQGIRAERARAEYIRRINRVIDHIEAHLDEPLPLHELADLAHFSRFHFHRLFTALVGESLHTFIRRLRMERAARQLQCLPTRSITEIALDCGFSSSQSFARAFKSNFQVSASEWRAGRQSKNGNIESKPGHTLRSPGHAARITASYDPSSDLNLVWSYEMQTNPTPLTSKIRVEERPALEVAYIRHVGPYAGDSALFQRLFGNLNTWASARGLLGPDTLEICIAHDDPELTEPSKLRTSVCVTVPKHTEGSGEVGRMTLPAGLHAVAEFEVRTEEIPSAWQAVLAHWLPQSGYQPDDGLCYEILHGSPRSHPKGLHRFDICVPVRPL